MCTAGTGAAARTATTAANVATPSYDRWRQTWAELKADPTIEPAEFTDRHDVSVRQAQWVRRIGMSGLLDSPLTLIDRIAQLAATNGHLPHHPASTS